MSKTLTPNSKVKIIQILTKNFWKKRKSLENRTELEKTRKRIYPQIQKIGNIGDFWNIKDFSEVIKYGLSSKNEQEFQKRLNDEITIRDFTYFIPIERVQKIPYNLQLGKCLTIPYSQFPKNSTNPLIKKILEKYNQSNNAIHLFLKTTIKCIGQNKAHDKFDLIIEDTLHILRFFFYSDIRFNSYVLKIENFPEYLGGVQWQPPHTPVTFQNRILEGLTIIGSIFEKDELTDIEERIKKAVILVSISKGIRYDGFKLSVLCSALEALLTTKNEPITLKLSERIAFLVKIKKMRRYDVYKEIRNLYEKRSSFIHQSEEDSNSVVGNEVQIAYDYIAIVIQKLVELHNKGFIHIKKIGDPKKSVIDGIDALKFGQIKKL